MEVMLYAKGISWIDDCRIPFTDGGWGNRTQETKDMFGSKGFDTNPNTQQNDSGRFPANILVSDDMLNDGIDRKGFNGGGGPTRFANATGGKKLDDYNYYGDKGSSSRYYDIDKWFDNLLEL